MFNDPTTVTPKVQPALGQAAKFKPLGDHVLVKPAPAPQFDRLGMAIPDAYRKNPTYGTVIAVGPGKEQHEANEHMLVKKGDVVLYGEYAGTPVTVAGNQYLLFRQSDFLGTLENVDVEADAVNKKGPAVSIGKWGGGLTPEGKLDPSKNFHETYNPNEAGKVTSFENTASVTDSGIITAR